MSHQLKRGAEDDGGRDRDEVKRILLDRQRTTLNNAFVESCPSDAFVNSLLTDMYQVTMAYAYWKNGRHDQNAVFDLYFRRNPFKGEFTIFAGLEEALKFVKSFRFTSEQITYLRSAMPDCESAFFDWLSKLTTRNVNIWSLKEGSVCFPAIPLLRVEGPIAVCQLLETPLLCLINYPSLVATNAARMRLAAGSKALVEMGLRRAQGPDGAMSASRYAHIGGFNTTSNLQAGYLYGMDVQGTHAHAYVTSYVKEDEKNLKLVVDGQDFLKLVLEASVLIGTERVTSRSELLAFASYATAFPDDFLALVDTYDTMKSGVPNFLTVAVALHKCGRKAKGIRLDSGDLAYLSKEARKLFRETAKTLNIPYFSDFTIVASNDLDEETLLSLNLQGHEIDAFGIGTNLVTCKSQPALGGVYKLVEIDGRPRIKLSQEPSKMTIPGRKEAFRLFSKSGEPVVDLLVLVQETSEHKPQLGKQIFCQSPVDEMKRAYVIPHKIEPLHLPVFRQGEIACDFPTIDVVREFVRSQLDQMRPDHLRAVNPTPYKVAISKSLHQFTKDLLSSEMPVAVIE